MRITVITLTLALLAAAVLAQQPPVQTPPAQLMMKTFSSSADVAALIASAKSARKGNQAIVTRPILQFAPYTATLEYRASVGPAALHEKDAEMMYVIDGSATLTTGGKLVGETRTNAANLSGTAIQNGESKTISKGDFIVVPEGTPHWFSAIDGTLVLMTIKMPRGATP
jgi:mannose-6-phosphate isomerase-like protein (cupin superfamily)